MINCRNVDKTPVRCALGAGRLSPVVLFPELPCRNAHLYLPNFAVDVQRLHLGRIITTEDADLERPLRADE
jgi:hypothetical protein